MNSNVLTEKLKKYESEARKIGTALLAAGLVFVLHCKLQVFEVSNSAGLDVFFRNLSESFVSGNFTDLFVWAALYLMIRYVSNQDKSIDKWSLLLAALFSVSYVLSSSYQMFAGPALLIQNWYQCFLSTFCIFAFCILFYFCIRTVLLFTEKHLYAFVRSHRSLNNPSRFLLVSFFIILICWLPWILMNYPGSFCPDAHWQLEQFFGNKTFNSHHPPLSTYIMGALVVIGKFCVDANFGFFLYILLQMCAGAWIFSFGISKLHTAGIRFRYCVIIILFYALTPLWGAFIQWYEKDMLYAEITVLFLIFVIEIAAKKECTIKDAICLAGTGILASLLRNNGIYAVAPTILLLVFFVCKPRRTLWVSLLSTLGVFLCFTELIFPSLLGIVKGSIAEGLSIPFQQTARYVVEHGDDITEDERDAIDSVLDYDSLADRYNPVLSDPVKSLYRGDQTHLKEYLEVWSQMFWKHPDSYISSLLNNAYGYLAPVQTDIEAYVEIGYDSYPFFTGLGLHKVFDSSFTSVLLGFKNLGLNVPLIKYLSMPGTYTWIIFGCALVMLKRKKYRYLIILVPEFINILVCIASPLANAIRYELPVAAAAPLLIGWTFIFAYGCTEKFAVKNDDLSKST